jgi:hypothetical protein
MGDRRWDDHLKPLFKAGLMDARWLDLRALPARESVGIYFGAQDTTDRLHAERIAHLGELHPTEGSHDLVRTLRDRGELERILTAALDRAAPAPPASDRRPAETRRLAELGS